MWRAIWMGIASLVLCGVFTICRPLAQAGPATKVGPPTKAAPARAAWNAPPGCTVASPVGPVRTVASVSAPQVLHDPRTDAMFSARFPRPGVAVLTARAGELQVEKTVGADGRIRIDLKADKDDVSVALSLTAIDVVRAGQAMHFESTELGEEQVLSINRLLAGSRAVRLMRLLAAHLDEKTVKKPAGAAMLLVDAIVGDLSGDPAAVERLGRAYAARKQAGIKRVMEEEGPGCYERYEAEVVRAYNDWALCTIEAPFLRSWCNWRWTLWAESAWWSFLSCSAFPFIR